VKGVAIDGRLLEPETLMPSQYLDRVVADPSLQPEKRLMLAVLESAVASYQKHALATSRRGQRLFGESEEWICEGEGAWIFSFENICGALHLDPESVRCGLRKWRAQEKARHSGGGRPYRSRFRRVNGCRHSVSGRPCGLGRRGGDRG
jgi:hypothetical protein